MFEVISQHPLPVISRTSPGAEGNRYGFEGGRVLKVGTTLHLFVSEMLDDPKWAKTCLAHWTSENCIHWRRATTLFESSGNYDGTDPRAALFLPQPVYDPAEQRWNLFYCAFRCMPNQPTRWLLNHDGRAWRAVSRVAGEHGIDGPYDNVGVVLEPGDASQPWEGLQGVDFFSPFSTGGGRWLAFYGSAQTQNWPKPFWGVGLVESESLAGPWIRRAIGNPVAIDPAAVENPVVHLAPGGGYIALYDPIITGMTIGITTSADGLTWSPGQLLHLTAGENGWLKQPRTPLGLIPRSGEVGAYDVIFTGNDRNGYACVGWCSIQNRDLPEK